MKSSFVFLGLTLITALGLGATQPAPPDPLYEQRGAPNRDGIGKFFMGREISHVMGHRGASWLERPTRRQEERTDLLMKLLPIEEGDVIHRKGQSCAQGGFSVTCPGEGARRFASCG